MKARSRTARDGRLPSGRVPRSVIRRCVGRIVELFRPHRVILFGSHATGRPTPDSDVDLMVVMPARGMVEQAARIRLACDATFPVDLLVRTPDFLSKRVAMGDSIIQDVLSQGVVLYESPHARVAAESRAGPVRRQRSDRKEAARP
jgi:predicted nucleotidyltransferase